MISGQQLEGYDCGWILATIHAFRVGTEENCDRNTEDNLW